MKKDHLAGGASRLAALLIDHLCPISSLFAPCHPGAALRDLVLLHRGQTTRRGVAGCAAVIGAILLAGSCGSGPLGPGEPQATITITSTGVSPREVRIKAFAHVRFVNNDTRDHTMVSDPINVHTQCPPINTVGLLRPGQSRETGSMHLPGTCGFHDHDDQVDAFRGRIIVE